jgi:ribonuclease HII
MNHRPAPNLEHLPALHEIEDDTNPFVIGIDEVGLGSWAGPLVVGGAVVRKAWDDRNCRDSKAFRTHDARERALHKIIPALVDVAIAGMEAHDIDYIGIDLAIEKLTINVASELVTRHPNALVVLDGAPVFRLVGVSHYVVMPQADKYIPAVSAASMYAKVIRDHNMMDYALGFPEYGFDKHKGYGTPEHYDALSKHGPCTIHRMSYKPMKDLVLSSNACPPPPRTHGISVWTNSLLL